MNLASWGFQSVIHGDHRRDRLMPLVRRPVTSGHSATQVGFTNWQPLSARVLVMVHLGSR
jgi:hypothetical protein